MDRESILDGTFDFCARCAKNNNCCVRTRHVMGQIASPPLLPREAAAISKLTGLAIEEFAEDTDPAGNGLAVKREGKGCFFYRGGECQIYEARPFDCRIFPFDIRETDGSLWWVVYLDLCPVDFDYARYFESAKQVLRDTVVSEQQIRIFTRHGQGIMSQHPFKLLDRVILREPSEA